ncbi:MAG: chemotaxis protein CheC [Clostridiales bacterium]|jgi:chemotaxis protein CheC|nr:chemotaxis protein CheC [Clostridiales bacterium]
MVDIDGLNSFEIDVLREIGNIGAGNAATALAKMLSKKVNMHVPEVRIMDFKNVPDVLGGAEQPVMGVYLNFEGDVEGSVLLVMDEASAHILIDMMMGRPIDTNRPLSDIDLSAVQELGNILTSSYLGALSTLAKLDVRPSIPCLAIDMAGAILSVPAVEFGMTSDKVLFIETEFIEGADNVRVYFFLVPDVDSYDTILKALGVIQ